MIGLPQLKARLARVEAMVLGLAKETVAWKDGNDPLYLWERREYLAAVRKAIAGLDDARVALAVAVRRLEDDRRG